MDQVKVGNYIALKRKNLGLTQKDLAELVEVTDKSISKWERGNGLPDVTRLKPLCDALKVSMNELVAGEDIADTAFSEKAEENIMSLIKENEKQKSNNKLLFIAGAVLAAVAFVLLGISVQGSSAQSVVYYVDPVTFLMLALFIGIGVLLSKHSSKKDIFTVVQKMSVASSVFIALFQMIMLLVQLDDPSKIGPSLVLIILAPMYGSIIYIIATIIKSHNE